MAKILKTKTPKRIYDIAKSEVVYYGLESLEEGFITGDYSDGDSVDIYELIETKKIKAHRVECV